MAHFDYTWRWKKRLGDRKGSRCRIVARGLKGGQILVEFESDGKKVVTSKYAVRREARPYKRYRDGTVQKRLILEPF